MALAVGLKAGYSGPARAIGIDGALEEADVAAAEIGVVDAAGPGGNIDGVGDRAGGGASGVFDRDLDRNCAGGRGRSGDGERAVAGIEIGEAGWQAGDGPRVSGDAAGYSDRA